jgi:hypothetical protein
MRSYSQPFLFLKHKKFLALVSRIRHFINPFGSRGFVPGSTVACSATYGESKRRQAAGMSFRFYGPWEKFVYQAAS